MKLLDLKNISERYIELINPTSPKKVLTIGAMAGLKPGSRVIDFGCGFGEVLSLWAAEFGISGVGIDIREYACVRARRKITERGLAEDIEIVCDDAAKYPFEKQAFDVAACIGTTFLWGGYQPTIRVVKEAIRPDGKLVIGEPYWLRETIPAEFAQQRPSVHNEHQLLHMSHEEGFDFEYVVRASHDDWDHYEAAEWRGLLHWIEENPDHSEHQEVIDHLHRSQEEYLRYGREYFGWAIYVLNPVHY